MIERDVVIIGAGPAGLACATRLKEIGVNDVLLVEREKKLGGILNQCIHDGFGLHKFKESLTGPEYIDKYLEKLINYKVDILSDTMVVNLFPDKSMILSGPWGREKIKAKVIVLAMGCRERTAGAIWLAGTRPAGIYTAGVAQRLMNIDNYMIGNEVVILGSGDVGLIMARRLTLEGARVLMVLEKLPYSSGLPRNIVQCLEDYNIPLYLKTTVTKVHGKARVEGVTYVKLDDEGKIIPNSEKFVKCDTLLLSVGLIPENELSREAGIPIHPVTGGPIVDDTYQTNIEGVFAAGNVLHVHDLADWASMEGELVAEFAKRYLEGSLPRSKNWIDVKAGEGIRYVLPHKISGKLDVNFLFRVSYPSRNRYIVIRDGNNRVIKRKRIINLHPAVMENIEVKAEELKSAEKLEVMIE
ncbi:MAG: NAD(P)/FAD-dependent oxidoreductase [Synergistetes bacterium]|nr:NAD(P)/FAD-dependent oxidoreductase [Synergistota bacterium]MCX8127350.1 NAD(P)/FAD-dependent oxidoreductase [Synergistota bacterium]MDW8192214.1 NAD(P)/FAD-dependent oxidoreductase [Synergistota bacterium]